jgi:leader peptidase (prepilin peptidase) / N-methyltransferase
MLTDTDVQRTPWRVARILESPVTGYFVVFAIFYAASAMPALAQVEATPAIRTASIILGAFLAMLSAIDIKYHRLPDVLTLPLLGLGLLFGWYINVDDLAARLVAALVAYILFFGFARLYKHLRHREGLGLGDAKLFAASGAWIGLEALPAVLFIASGTALCGVLLAGALGRRMTSTTRLPFGPFLAFGLWAVWLYGSFA